MNIDNKVLAYLQWKGEATTEQVDVAVGSGEKAAYMSLRRLTLEGEITKRSGRDPKSRRQIAYWKLNPENM